MIVGRGAPSGTAVDADATAAEIADTDDELAAATPTLPPETAPVAFTMPSLPETSPAGRATPSLLDKVMVDYYGTPTPVNQVAKISVPEPRMIVIQPWEKTLMKMPTEQRTELMPPDAVP